MSSAVLYARETAVDVAEFRRVLVESGLAKVRPVHDERRLAALICGANLIVTARLNTEARPLVGVARCVSDFSWCCYVSDLAVARSAQGKGIGQGLLEEARRHLGPEVSVVLVSLPEAVGFYVRAGMTRLADAFMYQRAR